METGYSRLATDERDPRWREVCMCLGSRLVDWGDRLGAALFDAAYWLARRTFCAGMPEASAIERAADLGGLAHGLASGPLGHLGMWLFGLGYDGSIEERDQAWSLIYSEPMDEPGILESWHFYTPRQQEIIARHMLPARLALPAGEVTP